jgi:hypothetical protein
MVFRIRSMGVGVAGRGQLRSGTRRAPLVPRSQATPPDSSSDNSNSSGGSGGEDCKPVPQDSLPEALRGAWCRDLRGAAPPHPPPPSPSHHPVSPPFSPLFPSPYLLYFMPQVCASTTWETLSMSRGRRSTRWEPQGSMLRYAPCETR